MGNFFTSKTAVLPEEQSMPVSTTEETKELPQTIDEKEEKIIPNKLESENIKNEVAPIENISESNKNKSEVAPIEDITEINHVDSLDIYENKYNTTKRRKKNRRNHK